MKQKRTLTVWITGDGYRKAFDNLGWYGNFWKTPLESIKKYYKRKFNLKRVHMEVER